MLKGVIFDMDGVLVDSHPIHVRAWKRLLEGLGRTAEDQELEVVRDGKTKQEILRHLLGELSEDQVRGYSQEKDRLFNEEMQSIRIIHGVRQLLNDLSRAAIPAAVASSGSSWRVHHILDLLELRGYFAAVVTGDEFKAGKSDPAIFRRAAERIDVRSQESLVFEDSVSGVQSASALGMKCLGIADKMRAKGLLDAGARHVYPDFRSTSLRQLHSLFA